MIPSNSTVLPKPTPEQIDSFIAANPQVTDDDIRRYANGELPSNPDRLNLLDAFAAPFMGAAKGATYGVTGKINRDYQKEVQSQHPLLYGGGELAGMLLGGSAEIKGLGAVGKGIAKLVPAAARAVGGTGMAARGARLAGRTAHAAGTGTVMAEGSAEPGQKGNAGLGAGAGAAFSLGMEGLIGTGGLVGKLVGRKDYLDMVRAVLNKKHIDAEELLGSLTGIRKANAELAYEKALAGKTTTDPQVLSMFREPEVQKAYAELFANEESRARQGLTHMQLPHPSVVEMAATALPGGKSANALIGDGIPLEVVHTLSRELRNNIGKAINQSDAVLKSTRAKTIIETLDKAEENIGKLVPEYAAADAMYASDSRAIHALKAGQGKLSDRDAEGLKLVKKYAGDIPIFDKSTANEIANWTRATREKALAGDQQAARDLEHYAVGVYASLKDEVENSGRKILTKPNIRNKIAALSGGDPDAAIKFYRAVTSGKERAADLAASAVWGAAGHVIMAAHSARRAVSGFMGEEGPDVFLNYLRKGANDQQAIMDKIDLLRRAETYHPRQRVAKVVAAKLGGAAANE